MKVNGLIGKTKFRIVNYLSGESFSFKQLTILFLPLLVDQAMMSLLNVINSSMVSSSGAANVSAVNMVDSLNMLMMSLLVALATGGTVVVAQYIGRDDPEHAGQGAAQAVSICFLFGLLFGSLLIIFSSSVLHFLFGDAEKAVMDSAFVYMIGSCASYPAFAVFQAVSGALRGMGDTRASMMLSVGMNIIIVISNVILIFGCGLGVLGVSISLNVSRFTVAVVSVIYLVRTKHELRIKFEHFFRLRLSMLRSIMLVAIPSGLEQIFFNGGKILMQTFVVGLGTLHLTAYAISGSMVNLYYICGNALNLMIMTVVGQCIGAGNVKEAKMYMHKIVVVANVLSAVLLVVLSPFMPFLYRLYSPPSGIEFEVFASIAVLAIGLPTFWNMSFITPSALRSAGDAKFTSLWSMLSMWFVRVMLGYLFSIVIGWGIIGINLAMSLEWSVRATIFSLRKRGTKWYQHKIIRDNE